MLALGLAWSENAIDEQKALIASAGIKNGPALRYSAGTIRKKSDHHIQNPYCGILIRSRQNDGSIVVLVFGPYANQKRAIRME